ncbi:exosortase/archaeosortase family protein [Geodermatophilus sp. SYSU D00691]
MTIRVDTRRRRPWRTGGGRRRLSVTAELLLAAAVCVAGYRYLAGWFQVHEAQWVAGFLNLVGVDQVSDVLPGRILVFRDNGELLNAEVTASCSAVLSVLGLTALTLTVLRSRRLHALAGLAAAVAGVVLLNDVRLVVSTLAGLWWGHGALVLFHDWVGTIWTFASTLVGFLLMVCLTLPAAERAEQNVAGHHTARRPSSWARPGLGYRLPELDEAVPTRRRTLTSLVHRFLLPGAVSRRLAARREAGRIDYRLGHLPAAQRIARVHDLAADGLGAHTATLLAVATYEQDTRVLDALAEAVAARQWEPVVNDRVAALRLWARGWLFPRTAAPPAPAPPPDPARRYARLTAELVAGPVPFHDTRPVPIDPRDLR